MPAVRQLVPADFAEARPLYVALVGEIPVPDGPDGQAQFAGILAHPGTSVWGAVEGDTVLAMATLHILPNMTYGARPYALVENVATRPSHQGQGHGRTVMEAVIDAAWRAGAYKIMLLTGRERGAKGFYERLGFTDQDKHGMTMWNLSIPVRQV